MDIDVETSWVVQLPELITGPELSAGDYDSKEWLIISAIRSSGDKILQILHPLGHYLTTESDTPRSKAVSLLAKIIKEVPEAVQTSGDVHHLAEFFTARLRDWPAIRGALQGCLALLQRVAPHPELSTPDFVVMLETFCKSVYVRSLAALDRATALEALHLAVNRSGQAALDADIDILEFCIASVDGEKDPRCLIQGFHAVRAVLDLYLAQEESSLASGRLEESTEELFDVLSCYFPVSFTPPPDDPHRITRGQIAKALEIALSTYSGFAPLLVDLITEKLSSTLEVAKLDVLSLLRTTAVAYGPDALGEHAPAIWRALKAEIMAPAMEGLVEPELVKVQEIAIAAGECLGACVAAFDAGGSSRLTALVLEDSCTDDVLTCVLSPGADRVARKRSVARVKAATVALGALGAAGGTPAKEMASKMVSSLLNAAENPSVEAETGVLAWAVLASLLSSMAQVPGGSSPNLLEENVLQRLLQACVTLQNQEKSGVGANSGTGGDGGFEQEERISEQESSHRAELFDVGTESVWSGDLLEECSPLQLAWLKLKALQAVFSSPVFIRAVPDSQAKEVLQTLVSAIIGTTSTSLEHMKVGKAAIAVLCAAAGSSLAETVGGVAVPELLAAATQLNSNRKLALSAIRALCVTNPVALLEQCVLQLDEAVQLNVPLAFGDGGALQHASLVADILSTIIDIMRDTYMSADTRAEGVDNAQHAACFACFAGHVLDAVLMIGSTMSEITSETTSSLLLAPPISTVVYLGTQNAPIDAQRSIGKAAALAVSGYAGQQQPSLDLTLAASCAALIALRKEVAAELLGSVASEGSGQSSNSLLASLASCAVSNISPSSLLHPSSHSNEEETTSAILGANYAAVALASFCNKLEPASLQSPVFIGIINSLIESASSEGGGGAGFNALAEVTRSLAMRGAPSADAIIRQMAASLSVQAPQQAQQGALFFGSILREVQLTSAEPALTRAAHAVVRPLWQQRTYNIAAAALDAAAKTAASVASGGPAVGSECPLAIILAMGSLLGAASPAVLRADARRSLPWLVRCLSELPSHDHEMALPNPSTTAVLLGTLTSATKSFLSSEAGRKEAEGSLPKLVPALMGLAQYKPSMAVRETSLQCLTLLLHLPYPVLHPYRRDVLRVAALASDDLKRSVRVAAAVLREGWMSNSGS